MEFVTSMLSMKVTGVYHIHGMCCETTDTLWNHLPKPKQTASGSLQNKYTPVPFVVPTKDLENYFIQQKIKKSNFFPHIGKMFSISLSSVSLSLTHTHTHTAGQTVGARLIYVKPAGCGVPESRALVSRWVQLRSVDLPLLYTQPRARPDRHGQSKTQRRRAHGLYPHSNT